MKKKRYVLDGSVHNKTSTRSPTRRPEIIYVPTDAAVSHGEIWEDSRFGICQPNSTLLERRRTPRRIAVEKSFHFSATFTEDRCTTACCTPRLSWHLLHFGRAGGEGLWIFHFYDTAPTGPTRFFFSLAYFFPHPCALPSPP